MGQTILVTGGAGYIGSHACKALAQNGYRPVTYDNLISGNEWAVKWGPFEKGDIRDEDRLSAVIEQYNPTAIMHFAALIQVAQSVKNPKEFHGNNVGGTRCLLDVATKAGIKNFIFSSTAAVYGIPNGDNPIPENAALKPINPYGETKLEMESMVRNFADRYGLNTAILRYFNAAGADPDGEIGSAYQIDTHIIPILMNQAASGNGEFQVFGDDYDTPDGTAIRDYIHVTDIVDAHIKALKKLESNGGNTVLNLGTSNGYSVNDVLEAARRITQKPIPSNVNERRAGDPPRLVADASNAHEILGWSPQYSDLETILQTAWAWKLARLNEQKTESA